MEEELNEEILKHVKDNRNEFKIFSTLAGETKKKHEKDRLKRSE